MAPREDTVATRVVSIPRVVPIPMTRSTAIAVTKGYLPKTRDNVYHSNFPIDRVETTTRLITHQVSTATAMFNTERKQLTSCACCKDRDEQVARREAAEERHRVEMAGMAERIAEERRVRADAEQRVLDLSKMQEERREGRIQLQYERACRKMVNVALARGWSTLKDLWMSRVRLRQLLKMSRGRVFSILPTVSTAFAKWKYEIDQQHSMSESAAAAADERSLRAMMIEQEAQLVETRAEAARQLDIFQAEVELWQSRHRYLESQLKQMSMVLSAREEEARAAQVDMTAQQGLHRLMYRALWRGWSQWAELYRRDREERQKANMYLRVHQRLTKPAIAFSFHEWRQQTVDALREERAEDTRISAATNLADTKKGWHAAEEEAARLRALLVERDQEQRLNSLARKDQDRALLNATGVAAEAKTVALQAREALSKVASASVRERALRKQLRAAEEAMAKQSAEARRAAEQQRLASERRLEQLLSEQRRTLDAQMVKVSQEAEERIRMTEQRCELELQRLREQQCPACASSDGPPPSPSRELPVQWLQTSTHPVWPQGPELNTAERVAARKAFVKQREEARQEQFKAQPSVRDAWAQSRASGDAYRKSRRLPVSLPATTSNEASPRRSPRSPHVWEHVFARRRHRTQQRHVLASRQHPHDLQRGSPVASPALGRQSSQPTLIRGTAIGTAQPTTMPTTSSSASSLRQKIRGVGITPD